MCFLLEGEGISIKLDVILANVIQLNVVALVKMATGAHTAKNQMVKMTLHLTLCHLA